MSPDPISTVIQIVIQGATNIAGFFVGRSAANERAQGEKDIAQIFREYDVWKFGEYREYQEAEYDVQEQADNTKTSLKIKVIVAAGVLILALLIIYKINKRANQ